MKKFLRIFLTVAALLAALSLVSCGTGASNPDDASGTWAGIEWSYKKSDHTLTLSGAGDIPGCVSSEDVPWYGVRAAVERIKFDADDGESFSAIGDYAFYGMTALEKVEIPEGVVSVGDCAFAFCSSLEEVTLPDTLATIGEGAFEACALIEKIEIPASTLEIGESAFAFCRGLKTVTVVGRPEQIKKWTFRDCTSLESFRMDIGHTEFDGKALEGSSIKESDVKSLHTSVVSVVCKDEEGNTIGGDENAAVLEVDEKREISAPAVDGYELVAGDPQSVVGTGEPISVEFVYKKLAEQSTEEVEQATDAPIADIEDDEKDDGVDPMAIVAIVIFVVVIAGIAIGAFFLIRSDKRTTKDSMTVRKSGKENNKKGKKK